MLFVGFVGDWVAFCGFLAPGELISWHAGEVIIKEIKIGKKISERARVNKYLL